MGIKEKKTQIQDQVSRIISFWCDHARKLFLITFNSKYLDLHYEVFGLYLKAKYYLPQYFLFMKGIEIHVKNVHRA